MGTDGKGVLREHATEVKREGESGSSVMAHGRRGEGHGQDAHATFYELAGLMKMAQERVFIPLTFIPLTFSFVRDSTQMATDALRFHRWPRMGNVAGRRRGTAEPPLP